MHQPRAPAALVEAVEEVEEAEEPPDKEEIPQPEEMVTVKLKGAEFHAKKRRNTEFNPFLMQNIFSIFSPTENFE